MRSPTENRGAHRCWNASARRGVAKHMSRTRQAIARALLWVAVINAAIWIGGTVFMMLVFNPLWTASPPESVRLYWVEAHFFEPHRPWATVGDSNGQPGRAWSDARFD